MNKYLINKNDIHNLLSTPDFDKTEKKEFLQSLEKVIIWTVIILALFVIWGYFVGYSKPFIGILLSFIIVLQIFAMVKHYHYSK